MSETAANPTYLAMAGLFLVLALWKGLALRREPTLPLALICTGMTLGGLNFVFASPVGYRFIGSVSGQPWLATLPIYVIILLCYAATQLLTLVWTPTQPDEPRHARRLITAWLTAYGISILIMAVAFLSADLEGPADPLRFNTQQADEPLVLVFLGVFLTMLSCGTLDTWRRSRRTRLDDPRLNHALRWFGGSMLVTFGYVVCSAPAIAAAAAGSDQLEGVGVLGAVFGILGCLGTCYGMSGAAVGSWLSERHDILVLQPLWDLVVAKELSLDSKRARPDRTESRPAAGPAQSKPNRLINVRRTLHRRVIEILDGIRRLERRAAVRDLPAQAVLKLHDQALQSDALRSKFGLGKKGLSPLELEAAATAAVLRDAVERLKAAGADTSATPLATGTAAFAPGKQTPAADERLRLVHVAKALRHPLVDSAVQAIASIPEDEATIQAPAPTR